MKCVCCISLDAIDVDIEIVTEGSSYGECEDKAMELVDAEAEKYAEIIAERVKEQFLEGEFGVYASRTLED